MNNGVKFVLICAGAIVLIVWLRSVGHNQWNKECKDMGGQINPDVKNECVFPSPTPPKWMK